MTEEDEAVTSEEKPPILPERSEQNALPRALTAAIVGAFAAGLLVHIGVDIALASYDGASTSFMLGGLVGAALAGDRIYTNRNGGGGAP